MKIENAILVHVSDTKQVSEKFAVREFVVEWAEGNPQYPQFLKFQVTQTKCPLLDGFYEGDVLTIEFNLRGKKIEKPGETLYFNSLEAWKIVKTESIVKPLAQPVSAYPANPSIKTETSIDETDDLPF